MSYSENRMIFVLFNLESVCFCVPAQVDKWHFQTRHVELENPESEDKGKRRAASSEQPLFLLSMKIAKALFAGFQGWLGPVEGATNGGQKAMRQTSPKLKVLGADEGYLAEAEAEAVKPPKLEDEGVSHLRVCECEEAEGGLEKTRRRGDETTYIA